MSFQIRKEQAQELPDAPTGLTATEGTGSVSLSWNYGSDPDSFPIQRREDGGVWGLIGQPGGSSRSFTDLNVETGILYEYRVFAEVAGVWSVASGKDSAFFPEDEDPVDEEPNLLFSEQWDSGNTTNWDDGPGGSGIWTIVTDPDAAFIGENYLEVEIPNGQDGGWLGKCLGGGSSNNGWKEVYVRQRVFLEAGWNKGVRLSRMRTRPPGEGCPGVQNAGQCPFDPDLREWCRIGPALWSGSTLSERTPSWYNYWVDMWPEPDDPEQCWGRLSPDENDVDATYTLPREQVPIGEWVTVEYYVKLNDIGQTNGIARMWINGDLVSDWSAENGYPVRWITDEDLLWNDFQIDLRADFDGATGPRFIRIDDIAVYDGLPSWAPLGTAKTPSDNVFVNEDPSYSIIAESPMDQIPPWPVGSVAGWTGTWGSFPEDEPNLTVEPVSNAPISASALRTRYPQDHPAGTAPVDVKGWDTGESGTEHERIYIAKSIRLVDPGSGDWELHSTGCKLGFIGLNEGALNDFLFWMKSTSAVASEVEMEIRQQNFDGAANYLQNVDTSFRMQVGQWHFWESEWILNDVGSRNGIIRWWIDGSLIMEHTNVMFRDASNPLGFRAYKWNPTWGGTASHPDKNRDDWIDISHIRISGVQL